MNKSTVDRDAVKKTAGRVSKAVKAGKVRRQNVLRQAVERLEAEIEKDPGAFARYLVSRMVWDAMSTAVYMA